jgi:hypothetical protein
VPPDQVVERRVVEPQGLAHLGQILGYRGAGRQPVACWAPELASDDARVDHAMEQDRILPRPAERGGPLNR